MRHGRFLIVANVQLWLTHSRMELFSKDIQT